MPRRYLTEKVLAFPVQGVGDSALPAVAELVVLKRECPVEQVRRFGRRAYVATASVTGLR